MERNYDNFKKVILLNGLDQIKKYDDLENLLKLQIKPIELKGTGNKRIKECMKNVKLILRALYTINLITVEEMTELEKYYNDEACRLYEKRWGIK